VARFSALDFRVVRAHNARGGAGRLFCCTASKVNSQYLLKAARVLVAGLAFSGCAGQASSPSPFSVTLTCGATTLTQTQQTQCTAAVTAAGGAPSDQTNSAQWTSSNPIVATVSSSGLVTGISAGTTDITARVQTVSAVTAAPPIAAMTVRISATSPNGLVVALQDVSTVTFDVSASKGTGLSYRLDYGDGSVGTNPMTFPDKGTWFDHKYHSLGTLPAQLTVTDSQGRQASATMFVTVKSLTGTWGNVIQSPSTGLTETRLLSLVQAAASGGAAMLGGSYTHPAGNSEPLTGSVESDGTIRSLTLNSGTISFSGNTLDGNGVRGDASSLKVVVKGGSADGLTLTFSR
jgi:hypothetical protein